MSKLWFLVALSAVLAENILVLLDSHSLQTSHSNFWKAIEAQGFTLEFKKHLETNYDLVKYGEFQYTHVILAVPSVEVVSRVQRSDLLDLCDQGGSLLLFGDTDVGLYSRRIANEFGFDFYETGSRVYLKDNERVVRTTNITAPQVFTNTPAQLSLTGIGVKVKKNSELIQTLVSAPAGAYAYNEVMMKTIDTPDGISLVAGFQGRNNARMAISGSLDLCGDKFWNSNKGFCTDLAAWAFQKKGVLRVSQVTHHRAAEIHPKGYKEVLYTIKDPLMYSLYIEELKGDNWVPFESDKVYVEFVMLDPKVRKYLTSEKGWFSTEFMAPDQHGVYQFKTTFDEFGYTRIHTADLVPVRHLRHDQFPRFLGAAFPYYISVFASITGFLVFSFFFLYHKDKIKKE